MVESNLVGFGNRHLIRTENTKPVMCHSFTQMIMKVFKQVQINNIFMNKTNSSNPQVERFLNSMCNKHINNTRPQTK